MDDFCIEFNTLMKEDTINLQYVATKDVPTAESSTKKSLGSPSVSNDDNVLKLTAEKLSIFRRSVLACESVRVTF